jgi:hypothetical protein
MRHHISVSEPTGDPVPPHLPRCRHCQDVIGVYEPLVLETAEGHVHTSLVARPSLSEADGQSFHRACYEQARRQDQ